jgi:hypothetical protein
MDHPPPQGEPAPLDYATRRDRDPPPRLHLWYWTGLVLRIVLFLFLFSQAVIWFRSR